jgi:CheY-like chemotaxis protein
MLNILVIDDDDFFRETLVLILEKEGYKVIQSNDAGNALARLEHSQPDLILTDMLMPTMNGMEFIVALSKQCANMPVIAMSGGRRSTTSPFNLESAKLFGVKVTLAKPFTLVALRAALVLALV